MSGGVILFLILLVVYFIPAIIASNRKHSNSGAIACLNIFLGWTFIGWVVALVWAFTDNVKKGE
ncbi:superinfection immunity protein [Salmonella enterica subsp. enterica serovar Braenderup]|nr:superinfection immunity protein [Salmonella enterica subsp. enterica serovar Miami]EEJ3358301.1 superinfection immunity protein [Salmonella enterica subsp. enterica serovar Braenderup]EJL5265603.1 superinfection immunity protein [Salmonella enterica]